MNQAPSFDAFAVPPPPPRRRRKRWPSIAGVAVVGLVALGIIGNACDDDAKSGSAERTVAAAPHTKTITPTETASPLLDTLEIKGRAPGTGYDRAKFGETWTDDVTVELGRNGCDTRNDILRRDLTDLVVKDGTNGCVALSGILDDPYTGTTIPFVRGSGTSGQIQIDHVVALANAWETGAQQLDDVTRRNLANDPRNLQATERSANQQKSAGDAATWLPPNRGYRCTYVTRQIEVKAAYELWITQAEHDAMARVLADCPAARTQPPSETPTPSPSRTASTPEGTPVTLPPTPTPTLLPLVEPTIQPAPVTTPPDVPDIDSTYYSNCRAARSAGAAPLYAGQPGYRSDLDRDGDGVACESG